MQIEDCFWSPVISKMCNEIIPYQYEVLNDEIEGIPSSHAIENFRIASGQKNGKYVGMLFQDSDVAKWIEAAAYSLKVNDDPEIRKKIERSSLFVLSSDFEGMPNALMEAMALGVPCISTDCKGGGARFLIKNGTNGLLTPIGDVEALQTAMEKILSDQFFADNLSHNAHKLCETHSPEKIYAEWENLIKKVVCLQPSDKK